MYHFVSVGDAAGVWVGASGDHWYNRSHLVVGTGESRLRAESVPGMAHWINPIDL